MYEVKGTDPSESLLIDEYGTSQSLFSVSNREGGITDIILDKEEALMIAKELMSHHLPDNDTHHYIVSTEVRQPMNEDQSTLGVQIRTMHPYGFRNGKWATITNLDIINDRLCYEVTFPDGQVDQWVAFDPNGEYEFRKVE